MLFLHGTIGSSTGSADMPQAIHANNALLRQSSLGTIPALLEALVVDPAMMIRSASTTTRGTSWPRSRRTCVRPD